MFIIEKHKNNRSLLSLFLMITFISSQTIKISSGFKTSTKLFINRKRIPSAAYKYNFHSTTSFNRPLHPSSIFLSSVSTDSDYDPSSIMMHQYPIEMSDDERYLFDLNGFLIVRNVLTPDEVKEVNEIIDKHQEEMIQRQNLLKESIKILNEREREILYSRRLNDEPTTLEDLSKKYKISRERVRQIENKAFEKLQKHMLLLAKSKNLLSVN